MILIAQMRKDLYMSDVLRHLLGLLPWLLATPDHQPRKINKAALAKALQKGTSFVEDIPKDLSNID